MITLDTSKASTATRAIRLSPLTRSVTIAWQSGHYSTHECRRRDQLRLLWDRYMLAPISYGEWVNQTCWAL